MNLLIRIQGRDAVMQLRLTKLVEGFLKGSKNAGSIKLMVEIKPNSKGER